MLGACVQVAPSAIVGAMYKCIGSVGTEVMDTAMSEETRIACGPTRTAAARYSWPPGRRNVVQKSFSKKLHRQNVLNLPSRPLSTQQSIAKF